MVRIIIIFVLLTPFISVPINGSHEPLTSEIRVLKPIKSDITIPDEFEIVFEKIVKVTWYNPWDEKQTDDTPGICAWGYEAKRGDKIIAISRDFLKFLDNGQEVEVEDYGKFIVRDKMNKRFNYAIDIAVTDPDLDEFQLNLKAFENGVRVLALRWTVVVKKN